MDITAKYLSRIQLVNWHFFENERICLNGSTLISGENTAGKSTVLDAVQLVLTTNSRKFNMAANEKGNRDLKGYVRCKVGNVGETYHRSGTVPANVALEFYDEKTGRYFVLGVHMLSPDEESPVVKKWYAEECRLEDLSFIVDGRAALSDEFRNKTARIRYMETDKAARDRFRHRMGNLDEKFFDIIPKSLAFKPMDNVKDFINKFVLSEGHIDVESLRHNISLLDELENTLKKTKKQLSSLDGILHLFDEIEETDRNIKINDILLRLAEKDSLEQTLSSLKNETELMTGTVSGIDDRITILESEIRSLEDEVLSLNLSIGSNEASRLVESLERRLDKISDEMKKGESDLVRYNAEIEKLAGYARVLSGNLSVRLCGGSDIRLLSVPGYEDEKNTFISELSCHFDTEYNDYIRKKAELDLGLEGLGKEIESLRSRQAELEKRQLRYPEATEKLKTLIEREYQKRGIESRVYILSDLLEITDEKWRNAVEGYLNTQKFYLIVEPDLYDIALEVYDANRKGIHSAGIINTRKIPLDTKEDSKSLAYVVRSENRYAKAYATYILGRVVRCDDVKELENHKIAITPECMLYQGYVVRHLNPADYRDPYIGINAYRVQLVNVRKQLEELAVSRKELREEAARYSEVLERGRAVNVEILKLYMNVPSALGALKKDEAEIKAELLTARNDPTLIELNLRLDEVRGRLAGKKNEKDREFEERARLVNQIEIRTKEAASADEQLREKRQELDGIYEASGTEYKSAEDKYRQNRKTKEPRKIYENFSPQRRQFENEKDTLVGKLYSAQSAFNAEFSLDFTTGVNEQGEYREAADRLSRVEIVKYEEKLVSAKADCESVFRSDFLSKMKEHIEVARQEFRNLNKALENVYYGEDSYHFNITFDKRKESLYRMITSEYNMDGSFNLGTAVFEAEYRDEIEDLFAKLMAHDDNGEKVVEEYTDYRSYLDYDIEIRKKNGQKQRFSDIYGEKSGSETQVPYYVAIAASFYQLYRYGNTVRLMLLDEAFDKMDDDRIRSMLEFMNGLKLQVIMATPPSKIEVIGENVGTVLTAIREGNRSIVEEYEL